MLTIKNVSAIIDATELLTNISLKINPGEIHAIMGPKKSGKSSLAHLITGHPSITQIDGSIVFNRKNLAKLDITDRAKLGIYTTFQGPPEIVGITNLNLAKLILKARKDPRSEQEIEKDYSLLVAMLDLEPDHGTTEMEYECISPSEFRKNELLLMLLLSPKLIIVDEIDADLSDNDLEVVGAVLSSYIDAHHSMIIITHSQKMLDMVVPTHVHIMVNGKIKETGTTNLYKRIVEDDYTQFS